MKIREKTSADRRREMQKILQRIMGDNPVYFQPPRNVKMRYPCIRYKLNGVDTVKADNKKYKKMNRYDVILIDEDPISRFVDPILDIEYCSFDRDYSSDNLNHYVFTIYN